MAHGANERRMKMDKDKLTTALGVAASAITAAQPVVNATQGAMHSQDYLQLAFAVVMAVFGFFTNKK